MLVYLIISFRKIILETINMNENELTQIEIDILDKMCLDNEEDKKFKEWYKNKNNNNM